MKMLFDEYNRKARIYPALLTALPIFLVKHYIIDQYFSFSLTQVILGDISMLAVLVYLFSQINRFISKILFEKKVDFPTDKALFPSSSVLSKE